MSTGQRFNLPYAVVENNVGVPINGAKLYFYLTGTTTPHDTWSDVGLTTPNTNPVVADSSGRFPNVFLDPTVAYKVVLTDASDVQIWTADPVQGVPPISQEPDLGGAWFTINLLDGGLVDTSQTTSQNILVHVDPLVETGITYLGNASPGSTKRIRVDAAADIFFGFDNFGAGQTLYGFNEFITAAYTLPNGAGRLTIDPEDIAEFVALPTTNTVGDRCWMLTSFKSAKFVSYMLRPNGNGHIDPADYLFVVGNPKYLETQPHIPMWSFMVDPTALSNAGKVYAGELDLNCVGDGTRIRMTAFAKDPVTGEPIATSPPGSYIAKRPGVISPIDGKLDFITPDWNVAPLIAGSPSSLYQGFAAGVYFEHTEDPTDVKTPGAILFGTCSSPSDPATAGQHYNITPWFRAWVHPSGAFVFAGKSAFEQGAGAWSWDPANPIQWHSPAGYCNGRDTKGWANVSIVASDVTNTTCDNFAALAIRGYNNTGQGFDIGWNGVDVLFYGVNASTRSAFMTFRPSVSNDVTWQTTLHKWNYTAVAQAPAVITLSNADTTAGAGATFSVQAGASTSNNSVYLSGIGDGAGKAAWQFKTANNAPAAVAATMFGDQTTSFNGNVFPATDNAFSCGTAGNRWSVIYAATGTINTSDQRQKADIADSALGLNFICALKPRSFRFLVGGKEKTRDDMVKVGERTVENADGKSVTEDVLESRPVFEDRAGVRTHYGLVAQEVKASLDALGIGDFAGWVLADPANPDSEQGLRMDEFISPLIMAVQQLKAQVDALTAKVAALTPPPAGA